MAHCAAHWILAGAILTFSPSTGGAAREAVPAPVATCTAVSVWDGDGPIGCREGWKVRLNGIAAREIDGTCRRGHPCPAASGIAARDALVRLLGGSRGRTADGHVVLRRPVTLRCHITGGSYGRLTAWCSAPQVGDLSCAMVASGTALRWGKFWGDRRCR